jgi:hypothetical protein
MAVCLFTIYLHVTSITSVSWIYLRIAFHSKRLHAALNFVKRKGTVSVYSFYSLRLHHKFVLGLPSHCFSQQAPSRCAFFCQEIWQRFSLQLTFTSPSSHVCPKFTFALLFTENALMLRLIFVRRYGSVSLFNKPSHHLHLLFVLGLTSHCFLSKRLHAALFSVKRYGSVSQYNLPSHHLHH